MWIRKSRGKEDESVPFLENTVRIHGQTEAAACLTASTQLSCLLWLHPACCRVEGGCCPCNCCRSPGIVSAWVTAPCCISLAYICMNSLFIRATLRGHDRPGPSEPFWRLECFGTVTQLSWLIISWKSKVEGFPPQCGTLPKWNCLFLVPLLTFYQTQSQSNS